MKILEIIPLISIDGGAESFVVYFANELVKQGHDCSILTLFDVSETIIKDANVSSSIKLFSIGKKRGLDFKCSFRILSIIKQISPDVVHVHVGAIPYILCPSLLYRKCKYFATIHSEAKREAGRHFSKWIRRLIFRMNLVKAITISEASRDSFINFYKVSPALIYNGVPRFSDLSTLNKNSSIIRFIHVARCHPIKNQELLLMAFNLVAERYDNIELNWYGTISEYPDLFKSLTPLFNEHIHYHGSIKDARIEMSKSDALCLSSKMEGMPITIIEAFSVGCIPICTPVGGCINMIEDGHNGILSKDLEVTSYADALERFILCTDSMKREMRLSSIKSFDDKYSIETTVRNYLQEFVR